MFEKYFEKLFVNLLSWGFGSLFLGVPVIIYLLLRDIPVLGMIALSLFIMVVGFVTYRDLVEQREKEVKKQIDDANSKIAQSEQSQKVAEYNEALWKETLKERASGFPTLLSSIAQYEELQDNNLSHYLITKSHPALSSAEIVKAEAKRRREAEFILRKTQSIIEYYENIAPFLLDFKEQEFDETDEMLQEYTKEEVDDPVTLYVAKEEYRKLPSVERNQLALDRFWKRPNKSKWLLGRLYERYVGYLYETQGYDVEYTGVFKGYEDLGRDLICAKGNEVIVIQCKNWSQFKTIFEKHIFQFFGTVFQYRDQNPRKKVRAIFYTTTELSDIARRFAKELKIELEEKFKLPNDYPCIKCNISQVDGTKIYHLPFDQQYDNTQIEVNKGEFYCATVAEAEKKGFRRAFRWHPSKAD